MRDIPNAVSPEQWRAAREDLLAREKEVTRAKDAVDAARRELPVTEVTKDYAFTGPAGPVSLPGLFGGRRQLITYHFMWRHAESGFPGEDQGCPDLLVPGRQHRRPVPPARLRHHPGAGVPRADREHRAIPQADGLVRAVVLQLRQRLQLRLPRQLRRGQGPLEYNYKDKETLARQAPYIRSGTDGPGVSVFLRDGDRVFHTYSAYQRGLDSLLGTYRWLDLTPLGRQRHVTGFPHHDTYDHEP